MPSSTKIKVACPFKGCGKDYEECGRLNEHLKTVHKIKPEAKSNISRIMITRNPRNEKARRVAQAIKSTLPKEDDTIETVKVLVPTLEQLSQMAYAVAMGSEYSENRASLAECLKQKDPVFRLMSAKLQDCLLCILLRGMAHIIPLFQEHSVESAPPSSGSALSPDGLGHFLDTEIPKLFSLICENELSAGLGSAAGGWDTCRTENDGVFTADNTTQGSNWDTEFDSISRGVPEQTTNMQTHCLGPSVGHTPASSVYYFVHSPGSAGGLSAHQPPSAISGYDQPTIVDPALSQATPTTGNTSGILRGTATWIERENYPLGGDIEFDSGNDQEMTG